MYREGGFNPSTLADGSSQETDYPTQQLSKL